MTSVWVITSAEDPLKLYCRLVWTENTAVEFARHKKNRIWAKARRFLMWNLIEAARVQLGSRGLFLADAERIKE